MEISVPKHFRRLFSVFNKFLFVHENIIIIEELSETHRRPTCLNGELDMLHQIPICNRHAPSETDMSDRQPIGDRLRLKCLIRDQRTCLIGDILNTDMPNRSPTRDRQ